MRKLILKCDYAPGDVVMLTAAVRDLHACYPKQFLTDVRTHSPEIWENNPHLTPLSESDPSVEVLHCTYPLIDRCSTTPYHCLHGFIEFLNEQLGLAIRPTAFKGDLHLSAPEKAWHSQVHELTGEDTPFWLIVAGGKYDITIKWWEAARYQQVVDHFCGRIQFVQVGDFGHFHPRLQGAIDLRGQTDLRQLIRLVYHAQGVVCPVTALMHLAAAVETRRGRPASRPCVVIAGAREPAHWEAYPGHQFIHNNAAVACGGEGGCWKDRTFRLRDGDWRDRPENLCVNVVKELPRCMDLITAEEVIRRIETYFQGGAAKYLQPRQRAAAAKGVMVSAKNPFDEQPLHQHNAGIACERFIESIPAYPGTFEGRGIVICAGGVKYFANAWVCIRMLRRMQCTLPIQLWHNGRRELDETMKALVAPLGVECVDAQVISRRFPARMLHGWALKPYAILRSRFREVMLLDADNVPVLNPEFLFDAEPYVETGAAFWPDYPLVNTNGPFAWKCCGVRPPREPEFETGQVVVDKKRCWRALCLTAWFNDYSDFFYQHVYGDKETFHIAFRKLKKSYALVPHPIHPLSDTMVQHDFAGRRLFQHRSRRKWEFAGENRPVRDFWFEAECLQHLEELRARWDGQIGARKPKGNVLRLPGLKPQDGQPGILEAAG